MEILRNFFKQIKWWEYLYLAIYFIAIIVVAILFKTDVFVTLFSVVGVLSVFFVAKGMVIGNFIGVVSLTFFCVSCFFNSFYGEIICAGLITLPSYLFSIYTWSKSKKKKSYVLRINNKIKWFEYVVAIVVAMVLAVGIYFLLRAFDTANLIVSTISTTLGLVAGYFMVRRSEYTFVFYNICNVISIVLWCSTFKDGNLTNLPMILTYFEYLFLNTFGLVNWIRLKRKQKSEEKFADTQKSVEENS